MATRKTFNPTIPGFFTTPPPNPGNDRKRLADKPPTPREMPGPGPKPLPPPASTANDFPNWANPEGRLQEYADKRYCPAPPRHPINGPIDVAALIVKLRGAIDTQAPVWLCGRIMQDAAYALEATIQHCYLCDQNHTGTPCDPGDDSCTNACREKAYNQCEHYAEREKKGV